MKVWECRIEVDDDVDLPPGADAILRRAAIEALEQRGIHINVCRSGWQPILSDPDWFKVKPMKRKKVDLLNDATGPIWVNIRNIQVCLDGLTQNIARAADESRKSKKRGKK